MKRKRPPAMLYCLILIVPVCLSTVAMAADFTVNVPVRITNLPERTDGKPDNVSITCGVYADRIRDNFTTRLYMKSSFLTLQNRGFIGTVTLQVDEIDRDAPSPIKLWEYKNFKYECYLKFHGVRYWVSERRSTGTFGGTSVTPGGYREGDLTPSECTAHFMSVADYSNPSQSQLVYCSAKPPLVDIVVGEFSDQGTVPITGVTPAAGAVPATGVKTLSPKTITPPK